MSEPILPRRLFLQLAAFLPFSARAEGSKPLPSDHGIGGTGLSIERKGAGDDQGIGGTGVFGRIQRFGSIYVNGLRIQYRRDVLVYMDGRRSSIEAMRVGHVVRAMLSGTQDRPQTARIDITSEVVGRIEHVGKTTLTVLSQAIDLREVVDLPRLKVGMVVAVFGIRGADGRIVASRIEARSGRKRFILRGIVMRAGPNMKIGGLTIARPASLFAGRRVYVEINETAKGLKLERIVEEALVPGLRSGKVLVETVRESGSGRNFERFSRPSVDGGYGRPPVERSYMDMTVGPDGRPTRAGGNGRPPGFGPRDFPDDRPPPPPGGPPGGERGWDFGGGRPPPDPRGPPPGDRR